MTTSYVPICGNVPHFVLLTNRNQNFLSENIILMNFESVWYSPFLLNQLVVKLPNTVTVEWLFTITRLSRSSLSSNMHQRQVSGSWSNLVCSLLFFPLFFFLQLLCRALTVPIPLALAQALQSSILRLIFRSPSRFSLIFFSSRFLLTPVTGALFFRQSRSNPTMS